MRMYLGTSNPTYCQRGDTLNTIVTKKLIHFFRISDFYSHFAHHPDYFNIIAMDCNCPIELVSVLRKKYIAGRIAWLTNRGGRPRVEVSHYASILAGLVDKAREIDRNLGLSKNLGNYMGSTPELEQHIEHARATWQTRLDADPMSLLFPPGLAHQSHGRNPSEEGTAQEPTHRETMYRDEPSHYRLRSASPASREPGGRSYERDRSRARTPLAGYSDRRGFDGGSASSSEISDLSLLDTKTTYDAAAARASNMSVVRRDAVTPTAPTPTGPLPSVPPVGAHDQHCSSTVDVSNDQTTSCKSLKKKYNKLRSRHSKLKKSSAKRYADLQARYDTLAATSDERHAELQIRLEEHTSTTEKRYVNLQADYKKLATKADEQARVLEDDKVILERHEALLDKLRKTQNSHNQIWKEIRDCLSSMD
jgi:hypothetical protein